MIQSYRKSVLPLCRPDNGSDLPTAVCVAGFPSQACHGPVCLICLPSNSISLSAFCLFSGCLLDLFISLNLSSFSLRSVIVSTTSSRCTRILFFKSRLISAPANNSAMSDLISLYSSSYARSMSSSLIQLPESSIDRFYPFAHPIAHELLRIKRMGDESIFHRA